MHPIRPDFHVHFINCGQGNMILLVTPDGHVVVYDCRLTEENSGEILRYLKGYIPLRVDADGKQRQWIDWFILSHRDQDHFHGFDVLHDAFEIRGVIDPGTTSGSSDGAEYQSYMALRREIRMARGEGSVRVPVPSTTPMFNFGGVIFYCLCSGKDDDRTDDGHYGNNVFQVEYAGNRVLLTGDSDFRAWKDKIMPMFVRTGLLRTTVLLASHHGSRSFFVDVDPFVDEDVAWKDAFVDHLMAIRPSLTVVSSGDQSVCNHPNEKAMIFYRDLTGNKQVYLTREKGTMVGRFWSDGRWTVTPARFLRGWTHRKYCPDGKVLRVQCTTEGWLGPKAVESGAAVPVGTKLEFAVTTSGGLIGDMSKVAYEFEVSNGGVGVDAEHDDIYDKGAGEAGPAHTLKRPVVYRGTHLLRVRVRQKGSPSRDAQEIFVVRGVD